jgi:antitoxin VapB
MALSIKTQEADQLARALAQLTGETMTEAVTTALRERLVRERARRHSAGDLSERLTSLARRWHAEYDMRPVSKAEWDEASGDDVG